jgi:hypothetical protein
MRAPLVFTGHQRRAYHRAQQNRQDEQRASNVEQRPILL